MGTRSCASSDQWWFLEVLTSAAINSTRTRHTPDHLTRWVQIGQNFVQNCDSALQQIIVPHGGIHVYRDTARYNHRDSDISSSILRSEFCDDAIGWNCSAYAHVSFCHVTSGLPPSGLLLQATYQYAVPVLSTFSLDAFGSLGAP